MGLKQWYHRKKLERENRELNKGVYLTLELPGEPLIYSIRYNVGKRRHEGKYFRNLQWFSIIKCHFRAYMKNNMPVVVIVRFYVTPPSTVVVKHAELKREKTPAVEAYELCDYFLSFMEMLRRALIHSYKQIVKIDMEKYYSANPRTVFQFMSWRDYEHLKAYNTLDAESKVECPCGWGTVVQPKQAPDGDSPQICDETTTD